MNETEILQKLYESEINFNIGTFWDEGFRVQLGDMLNGYKFIYTDEDGYQHKAVTFNTAREALLFLAEKAVEHYPESKFAKWWGERNG